MQSENLQIAPIGVNPTVYASQYDYGRTITFKLYDGSTAYSPSTDATVKVEGVKHDATGFSYECEFSDNTVTVELTQQMTVYAETVPCEIRIIDTDTGSDIGTLNFNLVVEESPINGDTVISETEIPIIVALATEQMQAAAASAEAAATSEENAATSETNAASSATDSENYSLVSEGYAIGTQDGTAVTSGTYYENNSKYYSEQAADSATAAATSESNAATSEANALVSEQNAKVSEDILEYYVDYVIPRFTIANNRLYLKDTATQSFIVMNNRLYIEDAS